MPTPTIIELPLEYRPKFPDLCICCREKPDSTIKITQNSNNPFLSFLFPIIDFFNWSRVEIPICITCKPRFRIQRYSRELILIGLMILAVFAVMPYFAEWASLSNKIAVALIVIALMIPYFLLEHYFPRYFDTTALGKTVNYEFSSAEFALEFFYLNEEHAIRHPFWHERRLNRDF